MPLISNHNQLAAFRNELSGSRMVQLAREYHRVIVQVEVGVGKSTSIDATIENAIRSARYDLVVALFPTRDIINERALVRSPAADINTVVLNPRPAERCGPDQNAAWKQMETRGLGILGRATICNGCQEHTACFWPRQYGARLRGAQVIFGTQTHLENAPDFLKTILRNTGAERPLVLMDENNFVCASYERCIKRPDLEKFHETLQSLRSEGNSGNSTAWEDYTRMLLGASTEDLRDPAWQAPFISPAWALVVQQRGTERYGARFRFSAYDIAQFCLAPGHSRERLPNGDIGFAVSPIFPGDLIVFSGTLDQLYAEYRIGTELHNPFADVRVMHEGTRWYNIASRCGAKIYFDKSAPQILDFFAMLTARRLSEGKRVLLVAKKSFVNRCAREMQARLQRLGLTDAAVVRLPITGEAPDHPHLVPIINYGVSGINQFEDYDCAYCLSSYYVSEEVLNKALQDILASDHVIEMEMGIRGLPLRRWVSCRRASDRFYDVSNVAPAALKDLEMGAVIQAVGRVRPFTKPREIITFQCDESPKVTYYREFSSLAEAREHFGIPSQRTWNAMQTAERVVAEKALGKRQSEVAQSLGVGLRTVQRYWN